MPRWPSMIRPLRERWERRVERTETCWLWTGAIHSGGYGVIRDGNKDGKPGKLLYAHRLSYEWHIGPIPKGLHLDHLCRTPACVNPAHLEAVTSWENVSRGVGWTAQMARATHCVWGHPFDLWNTKWVGPDKRHRQCRECARTIKRKQAA